VSDAPEVDCLGCSRRVRCALMKDGTLYRPFAWTFTEPKYPLLGWCPQCQEAAGAHQGGECGRPDCAFCAETRRLAAEVAGVMP
jgi:hypothetical protein